MTSNSIEALRFIDNLGQRYHPTTVALRNHFERLLAENQRLRDEIDRLNALHSRP